MSHEIKCMYPRRVNTDMIHALPLVKYDGAIQLVEDDASLDKFLADISKESVLGFDTETRPNFSKGNHYPVSILQLAGENTVWIVRLDALSRRLGDIFKVLENPAIKKAGIAVQGDIRALKARADFNPASFIDVSTATAKFGVINTGMRNLAALIFGERLSKAAQLTNWASDVLTHKQIEYAATDAWMSRRLFLEVKKCMAENRIILEPEIPPEKPKFNLKNFVRKIINGILGKDAARRGKRKYPPKRKQSIKEKLISLISPKGGKAQRKNASKEKARRGGRSKNKREIPANAVKAQGGQTAQKKRRPQRKKQNSSEQKKEGI